MKKYPNILNRKKLLAVAVPMLMISQAHSAQFDVGEVGVTLDSSFSIGSSWRMEKQNSNLLDYVNSGSADANTSNDGNLNYKEGDAFSQIFKGNHDLQLSYKNFGAFVRGKYWYDAAVEDNSVRRGHGPTFTPAGTVDDGATPAAHNLVLAPNSKTKLDDSDFNVLAKGKGATILDAFVYGAFDLGEMPLDVRLGKQVVSWGESTFIQGGINSINPVDAAAFRRPGAEVKEGLLPVNMAYANLGINDALSVEAFYQIEWQETVGDGCGTFFSTSDVSSDGCTQLLYRDITGVVPGGYLSFLRDENDPTREAKDDGQYGVSLRYFSDALNSEFGFYAMNIHSRLPAFSTSWGDGRPSTARYFMEYPEDIKLVGLSFAGNAMGVAISGEISHKIEAPVQINGTLVTGVTLSSGNAAANDGDQSTDAAAAEQAAYTEVFGDALTTGYIQGYRTFDITQVQATAIHLVNRVLGASSVAFIAEAGLTYVHDFDDVLRYGKSSIYQAPSFDGDPDFDGGFMTETSWGYRAVASAKYTNALAGLDLNPSVSFSHDVDGYAPSPGGQFQEDVKKLGLSLKANYLQRYDASISYNMFMGGDFNDIKDRDFLAISAGVQF